MSEIDVSAPNQAKIDLCRKRHSAVTPNLTFVVVEVEEKGLSTAVDGAGVRRDRTSTDLSLRRLVSIEP